MQAIKEFSATYNGRDYHAKKGQKVEAPAPLLAVLKCEGIVKETTKKETPDD